MPRLKEYTVVEVQDVRRSRRWVWTVKATSKEDAIVRARAGEGEHDDGQNIGDEDYGASGWAIAPSEDDVSDATTAAAHDLIERL